MSQYTANNKEAQRKICEILGVRWEGLQDITIKMNIGGYIEVDARFFVMKEVVDE